MRTEFLFSQSLQNSRYCSTYYFSLRKDRTMETDDHSTNPSDFTGDDTVSEPTSEKNTLEKLTSKGTQKIRLWRAVFLCAICITGAFVSIKTYIILSSSQKDSFEAAVSNLTTICGRLLLQNMISSFYPVRIIRKYNRYCRKRQNNECWPDLCFTWRKDHGLRKRSARGIPLCDSTLFRYRWVTCCPTSRE